MALTEAQKAASRRYYQKNKSKYTAWHVEYEKRKMLEDEGFAERKRAYMRAYMNKRNAATREWLALCAICV